MVKTIIRKTLRAARTWLSDDQDTRVPADAESAYPWLNALQMRITREAPPGIRPSYLWGALQGAHLAQKLGIDSVSLIEFGVAGGRGLVALDIVSECIERHLGVKTTVYGFDTGKGLPPPIDTRDCPNLFTEGSYPMDVDKLRDRLRRAQLILGRVEETVPMFLSTYKPKPIAFVAVDLDLYTSTKHALRMFEADPQFFLPRVHCFFDDILGFTFGEHNGERLAIAEFNQEHDSRKISEIHGLKYYVPKPYFNDRWVDKSRMVHILDHELYSHSDGLSVRPRLDLGA
jgi:hypothetical protein